MEALLGPMLTGGASLLGSVFSSQTNAQNSQEQMANNLLMQQNSMNFNAQQADIQRSYETQMSNTAYQRASADMTKAGLNPMMMFGSGGAASTPGGATATVGTGSAATPSRTSPWAGLGSAVASGVDAMVKQKQIDLLSTEAAKNRALTPPTAEGLRLSNVEKGYRLPEAELSGGQAASINDFLRLHPMIKEAAAVGPYLGGAADKTLSPAFDAIQSVYGGWKSLFAPPVLKGSAKKITQGATLREDATEAGANSARSTFGLPAIRQSWKDAGMTDDQYDNFVQALKDANPTGRRW